MPATAIGQRVPRVEGVDKVTGAAQYSADVVLPGLAWAKVLRSPHAYARIMRVDTTRARQLPGVLAVISAADIDNVLTGKLLRDQRILAQEVVRFIGEKVAAVAAQDPDVAEAALDLIEVEYEELTPVVDPFEAMGDGAPLLHPDLRTYKGLPEVPEHLKNVHSYVSIAKGDVEAGFPQADWIVEGSYGSAMMHQAYIEPDCAQVSIDGAGRIHVWASQKVPWRVREQLAEALNVPEEQIAIEYIRVGGDFGGKGGIFNIPVCYHLARACGRPVRLALTYTEELTAANPRHRSFVSFRTGVKSDGSIVAHEARVVFDAGAYGAYKPVPGLSLGGSRKTGGVYNIPNAMSETFMVYTNHIPCGFMRAPGDPQVMFAVESHFDEVARSLNMDPLEFRRRNLLREGDSTAENETWQDLRGHEVLDAAVARSNYGRPKRPNVGRGIAITHRHLGGGESEAMIQVDGHGQVTLVTGTPDAGVGAHTMQKQVIAEVLSLPLERVDIVVANTDDAPRDAGLGASRTTHITGRAIMDAAQQAVAELRAWAAELRGWPESEVLLEDGSFRGGDGQPVTWDDAAAAAVRRKGSVLEFRARYANMHSDQECMAAQVAEVEVDPETGKVTVLQISSAHDTGTLINPLAAEGQVEGGVIQGLGFATMEEIILDGPRVANPNMGEYKIPTIADIPELRESWVEDAPGPLPFGGRAIGEHSLIVTAAAIANAIRDACGARVTTTPLTAEKVYNQLHP